MARVKTTHNVIIDNSIKPEPTQSPEPELAGWYWISWLGGGPEIAQWDGCAWATIDAEERLLHMNIQVLSARLSEPSEEGFESGLPPERLGTVEYAGFNYTILKSGKDVWAQPQAGQHYAANKDKHKHAALEQWREEND